MADIENENAVKAWTIKNVPADVRDASINAANRVDSAIGEFVTQALREKIKRDRESGRQKPEAFEPLQNMEALERMVALLMQVKLLTNEPPPPNLTRSIYALIARRVKAVGVVGHTKLLTGPAAAPDKQTQALTLAAHKPVG